MTDTIAARRVHLLSRYTRSDQAEGKIASARALVELSLRDTVMLPTHRKHLIKLAQWWVTEADGKWKTRFKSSKVLQLARDEPGSQVRINHEHVFGRAELADRILKDPSQVDSVLELCIGCIVTVDEHQQLSALRGLQGWERYRVAGIEVCDTAVPGLPEVRI